MRARSVALVTLAFALAGACDKKGPPDEPPPPERPPRIQSSRPENLALGDAGADADASAAAAAVAELRRTKLELSPRRTPAERIVFARKRFAQLGDDALIVHDVTGFGEIVRVPLKEPRRVVELADGSLLAAGAESVARLDQREKTPQMFGRIPLFAESLMFGDRRDEYRLWVLHAFGSLLYQYAVGGDAGSVETLEFLDLEGFDQRAFCALKDGSFLYTAGDKLKRFFHGGKRWELTLTEGPEVWRLLTTRRIDQVWLARSDGRFELTQISAEGARLVRFIELKDAFDVASNDQEIAAVHVRQQPGKSRVWQLVIYDLQGKQRFVRELPPDPKLNASDDWVKLVTRDKTLALSQHAPLVAVGGPSWVSVWNTKTGTQVHPK
jgi:hypothetical protein